jgi:hypothetical protein
MRSLKPPRSFLFAESRSPSLSSPFPIQFVACGSAKARRRNKYLKKKMKMEQVDQIWRNIDSSTYSGTSWGSQLLLLFYRALLLLLFSFWSDNLLLLVIYPRCRFFYLNIKIL